MKFVLEMTQTKETKGTVVYGAPADAQITSVYIAKSALGSAPFPTKITVTVEEEQ